MEEDKNCISYWLPKLQAADIPTPETILVTTDCDLLTFLDGQTPEGIGTFANELKAAAEKIGYPVFLRSGHFSGKHNWENTCYVESPDKLMNHVVNIVNDGEICSLMGFPWKVWAVRKFLKLDVAFTLPGYSNMPLGKEFRAFIRDGKVECMHPYWPKDAVERGFKVYGRPPVERPTDWEQKWKDLCDGNFGFLHRCLSKTVAKQFDGYWSVDVCRTIDHKWYVTDMAIGEASYHWDECSNNAYATVSKKITTFDETGEDIMESRQK